MSKQKEVHSSSYCPFVRSGKPGMAKKYRPIGIDRLGYETEVGESRRELTPGNTGCARSADWFPSTGTGQRILPMLQQCAGSENCLVADTKLHKNILVTLGIVILQIGQ